MTVQIEVSSAQLQGGRQAQEDRVITRFAKGGCLIAVVADGLGGQPLGEWASSAAADAAAAHLYRALSSRINPAKTALQRAFNAANRAADAQVPAKKWDPAGTTLICGLFKPVTGEVVIGSLGDSLVFRRRGDTFVFLNKCYRTLDYVIGSNYKNAASLFIHEDVMQPGDTYLLASDGVEGFGFRDALEESTLLESARHCTEAFMRAVIAQGNERQDNVSLVAVRARA